MKYKVILAILSLSLIFILLNPIVFPTIVNDVNELRNLKIGVPIYYITQKSTKDIPEDWYPYWTTLQNPMETPTQIISKNLIISFFIVTLFLLIIYLIYRYIIQISKIN